jgi:hypothetical protein
VIGLGHRKGRIAAGFDADILAVDGDPIADPDALHQIRAVYARGTAVPDPGPSNPLRDATIVLLLSVRPVITPGLEVSAGALEAGGYAIDPDRPAWREDRMLRSDQLTTFRFAAGV